MIPHCDFTCTEDLCKGSPNVDTTGVNEKSSMPTTNDFVGDSYDLCSEIFFSTKCHSYTQSPDNIHVQFQ